MATIRFHLPDGVLDRVRFTYAPLHEAVLSLHVLAQPQHHPLHHSWVRDMRQLPACLRRELAACSFALGPTLPGPLARLPESISTTFEDNLADLRALPEDVIAGAPAPLAADDGRGSPAARAAMRQARDEPRAFFERLCALLEEYWEAAFATEWRRLEPQLADSAAGAGRLLAGGGLGAFIATLEPRVRIIHQQRRFVLEMACTPQWGAAPGMEEADVEVCGRFTFVPSAFSWPHAWASTETPWPLGMTYPAQFLLREARPRVPPGDLVQVLRACSDDVRLRVLRWTADRPRSTQELAPLIGITEPALSAHLHQLASAGLLEPRRDGKYVLYRLRRDPLKAISESLLAYLSM